MNARHIQQKYIITTKTLITIEIKITIETATPSIYLYLYVYNCVYEYAMIAI